MRKINATKTFNARYEDGTAGVVELGHTGKRIGFKGDIFDQPFKLPSIHLRLHLDPPSSLCS